jgi:putative DNA primase/helicase
MVFAGIGTLPATLEDRSIIIPMRRRCPNEQVARLRWAGREGDSMREFLMALAQDIARWVSDHSNVLCQYVPAIPEQLHDRAADNWSSLLAIADTIGGEWPDRARAAAIELSGSYRSDNDSIGVQLLHDVWTLFGECGADMLSSKDLCERLAAMEERPWASWRHGRSISPVQLARLLRPFQIHSRDLWRRGTSVKGYGKGDFKDAVDRYLPPLSSDSLKPGFPKREGARTHSRTGDGVDSQGAGDAPRGLESKPIAAPDVASRVLADQKSGNQSQSDHAAPHKGLSPMWRRVKPIHEANKKKVRLIRGG